MRPGFPGSFVIATLVLAAPARPAADRRLIEAVKDQDRNAIVSLLSEHVDVNAPQPDGATPLSWAVYLDQVDTVDLLMKAGAKVNAADEYGDAPLTLAATTGDAIIIEKLLNAGADATAARWNGETALMLAARSGNLGAVKLLCAHGANVNAVDSRKGQSALMWAAAEGHSDVLDLLIANGADVKAASQAGFNSLVFATQKGDLQTVSSLLRAGLDPSYALPGGPSVLEIAASGPDTRVAEVLLEKGARPEIADRSGVTPLHVAAQAGNLELVRKLLGKRANPNVRTAKVNAGLSGAGSFRGPSGQQTPLLLAARANRKDVMEALIEGGADPALKAQDGTTLLMAAAGSGHVEVVQYAYKLTPDIKAVTDRKSTVMHAAVTGSMQRSTQAEICKVIQFLADKGADLDSKDARGRTPLGLADTFSIDEAVQLLTKLTGHRGNTPETLSKQ